MMYGTRLLKISEHRSAKSLVERRSMRQVRPDALRHHNVAVHNRESQR